ncbi:response regulator [candidate division WOR-3 bacterium]|nr:response regulator [candidate division WOR-3 bacterium]
MIIEDTKILLVEDNPDDVELTLLAFKKYNLSNEIVVARDGQEALDILFPSEEKSKKSKLPDIILLDLKLPKVSGLEVLKEIKTHPETRIIPVIVLTTSNEDRDIRDSYRLGVNSYIRKPVRFDKFVEVVKQLGLYWIILNQMPSQKQE